MTKATLKKYLSAPEIEAINRRLGEEITKHYQGQVSETEPLLVVVTLKGAFLFASDLVRWITVPMEIDFVRVASYGKQTSSSGTVRLIKDIESQLNGRHVLVLDEIVDTGHTLKFLVERLQSGSPKSLKIAALLNKQSRREFAVQADFVGQDVEDKFLVGYGLDFEEKYRNQKDISYI